MNDRLRIQVPKIVLPDIKKGSRRELHILLCGESFDWTGIELADRTGILKCIEEKLLPLLGVLGATLEGDGARRPDGTIAEGEGKLAVRPLENHPDEFGIFGQRTGKLYFVIARSDEGWLVEFNNPEEAAA